jgi:hypothetical protein
MVPLFCPKCGQAMTLTDSHGGATFTCIAGDMQLSRAMHDQLSETFGDDPRSSGATAETTNTRWFCPGCGTPMRDVDGRTRCADCGRSVDKFIYGLVEFHPHRGTPAERTDASMAMKVGGLVDESGVCLAVYGEDLDPPDVTAIIGREPTSAHRKDDRHGPRSPPYKGGAWLFELRGEAPQGPAELTATLLDQLPDDERVWAKLSDLYKVQLRYGIHMSGWNRGFDLPSGLAARIARLRATVMFDIYAYDDEEDAREDASGEDVPGS